MATITRGKTFTATESVTNDKLHDLVDEGAVSAIVDADIDPAAAISDAKLAKLTTAQKIGGTALYNLASIPSGAGVMPVANTTLVSIPNNSIIEITNASWVSGTSIHHLTSLASSADNMLALQNGGTGQDLSSKNQGDIYYDNGTNAFSRLAPSTSGYYLQTNGAGANPSWVQRVLGIELKQNGTFSNAGSLNISQTISSGDLFKLVVEGYAASPINSFYFLINNDDTAGGYVNSENAGTGGIVIFVDVWTVNIVGHWFIELDIFVRSSYTFIVYRGHALDAGRIKIQNVSGSAVYTAGTPTSLNLVDGSGNNRLTGSWYLYQFATS
jgi:hypothetical protein